MEGTGKFWGGCMSRKVQCGDFVWCVREGKGVSPRDVRAEGVGKDA